MRVVSLIKVALLAGAVALPASFSAALAKTAPPPGSCAYGKSYILTGTFCSYSCDSTVSGWCAQQGCFNTVTTPALPCYGTFCTRKCGG
jgi:hypothetical protein